MVLTPPGVVMVMSTMPLPAGAVAVIWVGLSGVKLIAEALPNWTSVASVRSVPVIVTVVPAASGPDAGLMPVTAGAAWRTVAVPWTTANPRHGRTMNTVV